MYYNLLFAKIDKCGNRYHDVVKSFGQVFAHASTCGILSKHAYKLLQRSTKNFGRHLFFFEHSEEISRCHRSHGVSSAKWGARHMRCYDWNFPRWIKQKEVIIGNYHRDVTHQRYPALITDHSDRSAPLWVHREQHRQFSSVVRLLSMQLGPRRLSDRETNVQLWRTISHPPPESGILPPREILTNMALGFIEFIRALFIMPFVLSFKESVTITKSLSFMTTSKGAHSPPKAMPVIELEI